METMMERQQEQNNKVTIVFDPGTVATIFLEEQEELTLGEESRVTLIALNPQKERTIVLNRNAQLHLVSCYDQPVQNMMTTVLAGEGARVKASVLFLGRHEEAFQVRYEQIHNAPHTASDLLVKGALDGKARLTFTGLIQVHAADCNGYQKEDTLLLSNEAEANVVPDLEIHHNDVRCTHGVSISRLDPEQVYYAASRGIAEKQARQMLIQGFLEPVLKELPQDVQEQWRGKIEDAF